MKRDALTAYDEVALVLQGGGALGSYQAGVVEGLLEAGIEPNWVAGISIGAINAAIVAGNAPADRLTRLQDFWRDVCRPPGLLAEDSLPDPAGWPEPLQAWRAQWASWSALLMGQNGFFKPRFNPPWWPGQGQPDTASWYDTAALRPTLERVVDFDRLNHPSAMRLSVGAVQVSSGNLRYFDNRRQRIGPEHIMASGALPPGFPAVVIDGEAYWDGGLVSNTPLLEVLNPSEPARARLVFQVDLWRARGPMPTSLEEVAERQKDIQYSSRTRMVTDQMRALSCHRRDLAALLALLPDGAREHPVVSRLQAVAELRRCNVLHLIYQGKPGEGQSKDYEFSAGTMRQHWASGLADLRHTLQHPSWLNLPEASEPFVTHDVHR